VLRTAAEALYYHGVRLVVANLVWGVGAVLTAFVLTRSVLGLLGLLVMVPLTGGLMGMATSVVRERSVVMSDFVARSAAASGNCSASAQPSSA